MENWTRAPSAVETELVESVELLTLELSGRVMSVDWSVPEDVQHADRMMRVLTAYGRNIEKCLTMMKTYRQSENALDDEAAEAASLRAYLHRQLIRYAERLGPDELARRVERDRAEAGGPRVEILGET